MDPLTFGDINKSYKFQLDLRALFLNMSRE